VGIVVSITIEGRGALIGEEGTPQSTVQMPKPSEFSLGFVETANPATSGAYETLTGHTKGKTSKARDGLYPHLTKEKAITAKSTTSELQGMWIQDAGITKKTAKGKENKALREVHLAVEDLSSLVTKKISQVQQKGKGNTTQSRKRSQPEWFPPQNVDLKVYESMTRNIPQKFLRPWNLIIKQEKMSGYGYKSDAELVYFFESFGPVL
jgi:hypothetical protein